MPPSKHTRHWAEIVRTVLAAVTVALQLTMLVILLRGR